MIEESVVLCYMESLTFPRLLTDPPFNDIAAARNTCRLTNLKLFRDATLRKGYKNGWWKFGAWPIRGCGIMASYFGR
jgi:hypothetical protein